MTTVATLAPEEHQSLWDAEELLTSAIAHIHDVYLGTWGHVGERGRMRRVHGAGGAYGQQATTEELCRKGMSSVATKQSGSPATCLPPIDGEVKLGSLGEVNKIPTTRHDLHENDLPVSLAQDGSRPQYARLRLYGNKAQKITIRCCVNHEKTLSTAES